MAIVPQSVDIIDSAEQDYLYVQESQIPNAGKGLFTAIKIYKHEVIAIFDGEILSTTQAKIRVDKNENGYFINLLNGKIMDSMHTDCFAKFANDADGCKTKLFKNNCIIMMVNDTQVGIVAIQPIKVNAEIFCSYGKAYWLK
jgi:uncharacterized protein